jgi:glycosyltransferase involved in cell wall biosynthesis
VRVLHIINDLGVGGAQSVLAQLLAGSSQGRHRAMVVALTGGTHMPARLEAMRIPVEFLDMRRDWPEPTKLSRLVGIIRKYQPDVVQTWLYHSDLIGTAAAWLAGRTPVVWGIHHTTEGRRSVKRSTWIVVQLLAGLSRFMPSRIVCCSHSAFRTHASLGYRTDRMVVIPNGIDTRRFRPRPAQRTALRSVLGLPPRARLIGMFARYHPQKDHGTLVRAAELLLRNHPKVHFVLAGEGIDAANVPLQRAITRTGFRDHFRLLGIRQDLPELCAAMDVVTLSSAYGEALPLSIVEAMSCATPCVATNVGDTAEVIGATGVVVAPNQPAALAAGWLRVLRLSELEYHRMGSQARRRIRGRYDLATMVGAYLGVYKEIASHR